MGSGGLQRCFRGRAILQILQLQRQTDPWWRVVHGPIRQTPRSKLVAGGWWQMADPIADNIQALVRVRPKSSPPMIAKRIRRSCRRSEARRFGVSTRTGYSIPSGVFGIDTLWKRSMSKTLNEARYV